VLDSGLLECLAVIAAANGRSLEDELNLAVKTYVVNESSRHGQEQLLDRARSNLSATAAS
jgi:plasmid stability protein